MKSLSPRLWASLLLLGLTGQFAWTIENMYFNVYLYNTISTEPGYIAAMVAASAVVATLTTLLMGGLYLRGLYPVGPEHRRLWPGHAG